MYRGHHRFDRLKSHGWVVAVIALSIAAAHSGCRNVNWRGQNADAEGMKFDASSESTKYVSQATGVWGLGFAEVEGFALVTQLDATGADPPLSPHRTAVLKDMQAHNVRNANEILSSNNTSIAKVSGHLPPGIRKGDHFDVMVQMGNDGGTSLRDGFVMQSRLRPIMRLGSRDRSGHDTASVKGRILVDAMFADSRDPNLERRGVILGGGTALEDRPLGLALKDELASVKMARAIAHAVNERFDTYDRGNKVDAAEAKNDHSIELIVPQEYRRNVGRFIQVVMNTAFLETAQQKLNRLEQLELDLSDPALCETAALRLESIGKNAIPVLRRGLRDPSMEVRFHSAQTLTYLDQSDGIAELKKAALDHPDFRWHALTALASSSELDAGQALIDLMHADSVETRYGAFHALKIRSPNDPLVAPDPVSRDFYLNVVPTTASSVVHFARQHRPEIVVFGGEEPLESSLLYVERGLTVRCQAADLIEITRFDSQRGEVKVTCPNSTVALIRTLTQIGCDYGTIFDICIDAKQAKAFNARVEVDRLPSSMRARYRDIDRLAIEEPAESPDGLPTMFSGPEEAESQAPLDDVNTRAPSERTFLDKMKTRMWGG